MWVVEINFAGCQLTKKVSGRLCSVLDRRSVRPHRGAAAGGDRPTLSSPAA